MSREDALRAIGRILGKSDEEQNEKTRKSDAEFHEYNLKSLDGGNGRCDSFSSIHKLMTKSNKSRLIALFQAQIYKRSGQILYDETMDIAIYTSNKTQDWSLYIVNKGGTAYEIVNGKAYNINPELAKKP